MGGKAGPWAGAGWEILVDTMKEVMGENGEEAMGVVMRGGYKGGYGGGHGSGHRRRI